MRRVWRDDHGERHWIRGETEQEIADKIAELKFSIKMGQDQIDGKMTAPAGVRKAAYNQFETALEVTIHDGRNRQVRRLCEREGLRVRKLTRVAEGSLLLGELDEGKWRKLTDKEIRKLLQ